MKTTNLSLPRARWAELSPPVTAAICVFALLLIGLIVGRVRSLPSAAAVPTPALPVIVIATQPAIVPPTAAPPAAQVAAVVPENVTQRAIGVFGAPDTATYIGSVEAGRAFAPVARYGAEWIQVDMDGSGRVFVRASDLYNTPELVDLKPAPAPVVVERPIYVAAPIPAAPTPAPEQYQIANEPPPTLAPQQAAIYDRQVWALQRAGR